MTVRELASSGRVKRSSFRKPQTLESCTEVQNVATTLTTLVQKSPSSLDVPVQAARITASSGLICTPQEKVALSEIDDDFEEARTTIKSALRPVQEQLVTDVLMVLLVIKFRMIFNSDYNNNLQVS